MQSTGKKYLLPFLTHVTPVVGKALFYPEMEEYHKYHYVNLKKILCKVKELMFSNQ